MRITNVMTTNRMYNNITKNKVAVDRYYNQLTTGKRIQYASDNPILASRILKFRTTLSEAEQYRRNVNQGSSWLEISEIAVGSVQDIMNKIRELALQGASDTYDASDREKILADIKNLVAEVGMQMNQSYGGRYVFSGYRTDTEPVFNGPNDFNYQITQDFNYLDIETFRAYSKLGLDDLAQVFDATRIKLPYKDVTDVAFKTSQEFGVTQDILVSPTQPTGTDATFISNWGENGALMLSETVRDTVLENERIRINGVDYPVSYLDSGSTRAAGDTVYYDEKRDVFYLPKSLIDDIVPDEGGDFELTLDEFDVVSSTFTMSGAADGSEVSGSNELFYMSGNTIIFNSNIANQLVANGKVGIDLQEYEVIEGPGADPNVIYYDATDPDNIIFTLPPALATTVSNATSIQLDVIETVPAVDLDVTETQALPDNMVSFDPDNGPHGGFILPDSLRDILVPPADPNADPDTDVRNLEISIAGKQYDIVEIDEFDRTKPLDQTKVYYDKSTNMFYLPNELTEMYKTSALPLDLEPPVTEKKYSITSFSDLDDILDSNALANQSSREIYYVEDSNAFILPTAAIEDAQRRGRITIGGESYKLVEGAAPNPRPSDDKNIYMDASSTPPLFHFPDEAMNAETDLRTVPTTITFQEPTIEIFSLKRNDVDAYSPLPGAVHYIEDTGELIIAPDVAEYLTNLGREGFQIAYEKSGFTTGEINPKVYFDCKDLDSGKRYDMDNQDIEYEFGLNIRIAVNNLAKDMLTPEMFSDLMEFCAFVDGIETSNRRDVELKYEAPPYNLTGEELKEAVDEQLKEESTRSRAVLQARFESLIGSMDEYMSSMSKQRTDLGSRMSRLELMENRLGDDIVAYSDLLSDNEDVDMMEAIMYLNITESIYQASLNVGAKILQTTLVDFLR